MSISSSTSTLTVTLPYPPNRTALIHSLKLRFLHDRARRHHAREVKSLRRRLALRDVEAETQRKREAAIRKWWMLRGLRGEELVFSEYCWEFDEGVESKGIRRLEEEMRDWEGRVEGLIGGDEDEGEEEGEDGEDVCWAGDVELEELEEEINEELELDEELMEALVKALEALEQLEEEELKQLEEEEEELEPEDLDVQRTFPDQADAEDGWVVVP